MDRKIQIGALISGGGTNLQAIIDACQGTKIDGQMVFVGADNPGVSQGLAKTILPLLSSTINPSSASLIKTRRKQCFRMILTLMN